MKVRCIKNRGADLPQDCLRRESGFTEETEFGVVLGKIYTVYGFTLLFGHVWFYLCDESYTYYPVWNPSPLFQIVDHRLSAYWEFHLQVGTSAEDTRVIVAFPEWARDPLYYDRLTNRDKEAVEIFERYKDLIDAEHA